MKRTRRMLSRTLLILFIGILTSFVYSCSDNSKSPSDDDKTPETSKYIIGKWNGISIITSDSLLLILDLDIETASNIIGTGIVTSNKRGLIDVNVTGVIAYPVVDMLLKGDDQEYEIKATFQSTGINILTGTMKHEVDGNGIVTLTKQTE